jgi:hypothetical protein
MEGERVSFCRVLIDLNVGKPKRDVGDRLEIFIPSWGPTAVMGGTIALPIPARFATISMAAMVGCEDELVKI